MKYPIEFAEDYIKSRMPDYLTNIVWLGKDVGPYPWIISGSEASEPLRDVAVAPFTAQLGPEGMPVKGEVRFDLQKFLLLGPPCHYSIVVYLPGKDVANEVHDAV